MARAATRTAPRTVRRPEVKNADPLVDSQASTEPSPPQMDYPAHIATYNRFLGMIKWFVIHMCFLVPALYFFIIQGMAGVGFAFLALGIGVLIWGVLRNPKVKRDVDVAFDDESPRSI